MNGDTSVRGTLFANKILVHCDKNPAHLGRYEEPHAAIVGEATEVAAKIIEWLDLAEVAPSSFRSGFAAERLKEREASRRGSELQTRPGTVDLRAAIEQIDAVVPADRVFLTDPGRHVTVTWPTIKVRDPRDLILTGHFGAIGTGMPIAIGAACADQSRPVLLVGGDGGFMLGGLVEFNTAVRQNLDLIVVICNDGTYGPEHKALVDMGGRPDLVEFAWPDLGPVATALGGEGITVRNDEDLRAACDLIKRRSGPVLIDLKLDPYRVPNLFH